MHTIKQTYVHARKKTYVRRPGWLEGNRSSSMLSLQVGSLTCDSVKEPAGVFQLVTLATPTCFTK